MKKQVVLDLCSVQSQLAAARRLTQAGNCELAGVMISWGETPLEQICGDAEKPAAVYVGCPGPLARHLYQKNTGHAAVVQFPDCAQKEHAVAFLIRTCRSAEKPITIAALGPLTNIGMALRIAPDISGKIRKVVMVDTLQEDAFASKNLQMDPEAAQIAIHYGVALTIVQVAEDADLVGALLWALEESNDSKGKQTHLQICIDRGQAAGVLLCNPKRQPNARIITEEVMNS